MVFVFLTVSANFRPCFSNNNVHVAWTLLQPISLPYPHQAMLRGPTRKLTTWLLSTLCRGKRGQIQLLPSNRPNTFFNDCSLVMFHFFFLRPFFSTLNFTLIFARTREWSDPMSTLWNDLVLSTAESPPISNQDQVNHVLWLVVGWCPRPLAKGFMLEDKIGPTAILNAE